MKDLIQAHKKLISTVKEQMGFSDYGMYWLAFIEGGLTIWLLQRVFFHLFLASADARGSKSAVSVVKSLN